ncbi:MAG: hypothetical protein IKP02_02110 [Paludibacteraceae bacterium]|nr:hypothetical protein [Paludibacteraceae bacterium]
MRKTLVFLMLMTVSLSVFARPQRREVIIDTVCNAPLKQMLTVTNRFCRQFQAGPDSLFEWAYLGLAEEPSEPKTKESRDAIQLRYKDRVYDPKLKTGDVAVDIYVLGVRWWKDQHLGTKYMLTRPVNASYPLTAHLKATYSGSILEGGDMVMVLEPISDTQTRIHYEFRLVFGRVLSAFISDKTWHNAIEWRFGVILENMIECAETGTVLPKKRGPKN